MAGGHAAWCWVLLATLALRLPGARPAGGVTRAPLQEFASFKVVSLKLLHGKKQKVIPSTLEQNGRHVQYLTITYDLDGHEYILDLVLNTDLIPESYFEKNQLNDGYVIKTSKDVITELCHYHGHIRRIPNSWAAITTCNGTSGVIFDGNELHYLESSFIQDDEKLGLRSGKTHFLYSRPELKSNLSCGTPGKYSDSFSGRGLENTHRFKRDIELTWSMVHGPYNSNKLSRYVELILVADNSVHRSRGSEVYNYCKQVANIVNRMYNSLNVYIALVGVVVWDKRDEIRVTSSSDDTLKQFLEYRENHLLRDHPNDNAHLITQTTFDSGIVGKAMKSAMCSTTNSGGIIKDHSSVVAIVAHTLAHEMGHNFGMEHDGSECRCDGKYCIMGPSVSSEASHTWSSCSLEYITGSYELGLDYCLHNKPKRLFQGPVCGNGFVEDREECDCGLEAVCDNPCCDSSTCKLRPGANCATGHCCDLQKCDLKPAGTLCRSADRECDLPEFCTGESETCPDDVFKVNGDTCLSGQAFCYEGKCRTHDSQCQLLWGQSAKSAPKVCYAKSAGDTHIKERDAACGVLQCTHAEEDNMQFGNTNDAVKHRIVIPDGRQSVYCAYVTMSIPKDEEDAGRVPDGAKCGKRKMCVSGECVSVNSVRLCASNCSEHGVCNTLGHCHCDNGFAPPECDVIGPGGSLDSGPASNPYGNFKLAVSLYTIFLGIVPLLVLVALAVHVYRHKSKNRNIRIAATKASGHPINKPSFFRWNPRRRETRTPRSTGGQQGSSPRPDISRRELLSTTNTAVLATMQAERGGSVPRGPAPAPPPPAAPPAGASGRRFSLRTRKVSLTKRLSLKMKPAHNAMARNLLEPSDSSGASTPDTPPASRPEAGRELPGLSVAQLAARFHARDQQGVQVPSAAPAALRQASVTSSVALVHSTPHAIL